MYATAEDMRARYGEVVLVQLADAPAWDATAIARVNQMLTDAAAEIDGYVAKYYAPAAGVDVPPLLRRINMTIAFADLHRVVTEDADKARSEARRQLRDISNGLLKIDEGNTEALPAREGAIIVPDRERTFSRDRLTGF